MKTILLVVSIVLLAAPLIQCSDKSDSHTAVKRATGASDTDPLDDILDAILSELEEELSEGGDPLKTYVIQSLIDLIKQLKQLNDDSGSTGTRSMRAGENGNPFDDIIDGIINFLEGLNQEGGDDNPFAPIITGLIDFFKQVKEQIDEWIQSGGASDLLNSLTKFKDQISSLKNQK